MYRDGYICRYCGISELLGNDINWEIDHIQPIDKGGSDWVTNLALSCKECNRSKAAKLPIGKYKPTPVPLWRKVLSLALTIYYKDIPTLGDFV
jgi:5-methylcytosine-specific restriction endonuclease McrA